MYIIFCNMIGENIPITKKTLQKILNYKITKLQKNSELQNYKITFYKKKILLKKNSD